MQQHTKFYIDGQWVEPAVPRTLDVINPSTEQAFARIGMGSAADVDAAVAAARRAFEGFRRPAARSAWRCWKRFSASISSATRDRAGRLAGHGRATVAVQGGAGGGWRGAPVAGHPGAQELQLRAAAGHHHAGARAGRRGRHDHALELADQPDHVQGRAGTGRRLHDGAQPSEVAPLSAILVAQVLHEAGVPPGVFNLVNGDGPTVGEAMAAHPDIDMMTFTGSTRAGIAVAKAAADSVKRVTQELGGKSANIVLDDADLEAAVAQGVQGLLHQFRPELQRPDSHVRAARPACACRCSSQGGSRGDAGGRRHGRGHAHGAGCQPAQFKRIQALIETGIDEGATLVAGGPGRPEGLAKGFFVRPTVFADVRSDMVIAREEIFGPVLVILPYDTEEDAIGMANASPYGLSGYVQSASLERARRVAFAPAHRHGPPQRRGARFRRAVRRLQAIRATAANGASMASASSWKSRP